MLALKLDQDLSNGCQHRERTEQIIDNEWLESHRDTFPLQLSQHATAYRAGWRLFRLNFERGAALQFLVCVAIPASFVAVFPVAASHPF
jgi:hypothetical protein